MTDQRPPWERPYENPRPTGPYDHRHTALPEIKDPKKRRRFIILGVVVVFALFVLFSCAAILSSATPGGTPANTPVGVVPSRAVQDPPSAQITPTPAVAAAGTSFGDGTWLVGKGKEVEPGTYRTPGSSGSVCAALVSKNDQPVNGTTTTGENSPARITLTSGQTIQSTGCQTWQKVG